MADNQFDVSADEFKKIQERANRRAALRADFIKQASNPHMHGHGGGVTDPALYRYNAMRVSNFEHFKSSATTTRYGMLLIVIPMFAYGYLLKSTRDKQEAIFRRGEVAYKDRLFKYQ